MPVIRGVVDFSGVRVPGYQQTAADYRAYLARLQSLRDSPPAAVAAALKALLDALEDYKPGEVVAVESSPDCAGVLYRAERQGVTIKQRDFLETSPEELGTFDSVVMNPPFHMRADIRHIEHALTFLKPGGTLAALCMDGHLREEKLRHRSATWERIESGTFAAEGTKVATILLTIVNQ